MKFRSLEVGDIFRRPHGNMLYVKVSRLRFCMLSDYVPGRMIERNDYNSTPAPTLNMEVVKMEGKD